MKKIFLLIFCSALLLSCNKDIEVSDISFNVTAAETTVQVGKPVKFNLSGNPDNVTFYSGEFGKDFDFKDKRILTPKTTISFDAQILDGTQANQFSVLVSSDFNGVYDYSNVTGSTTTWTDISNRVRLALPADNRVFVPSGSADVSDLVVAGKPLYLAYKYVGKPVTANGTFNIWRVQNTLVQSSDDFIGTETLLTQENSGFRSALSPTYESSRIQIFTTSVTFRGNATAREVLSEAWSVSRAINVLKNRDLGLDKGTPIKSIAEPALKSYSYVFTKPGTYKVTFLAINASLSDRKEQIKQIEIVVTP